MGRSIEWLRQQIDMANLSKTRLRVVLDDGTYVFGAIMSDSHSKNRPDYFSISSIYDTIVDVSEKIEYSFDMAAECDPSETLENHIWFGTPQNNEITAAYFIENMVFRTAILWDMLAQICNELWLCGRPKDKIYAEQFFQSLLDSGEPKSFVVDICAYFSQEDEIRGDMELWDGNHKYVKTYRNQMTHRNSPNISTMSSFALELRPPAIFVLKRVTEDYLKAVEFINVIMDEVEQAFSSFNLSLDP